MMQYLSMLSTTVATRPTPPVESPVTHLLNHNAVIPITVHYIAVPARPAARPSSHLYEYQCPSNVDQVSTKLKVSALPDSQNLPEVPADRRFHLFWSRIFISGNICFLRIISLWICLLLWTPAFDGAHTALRRCATISYQHKFSINSWIVTRVVVSQEYTRKEMARAQHNSSHITC